MLLITQSPNQTQSKNRHQLQFNAQEQEKQHIELQQQHSELAEQVPAHEIASAPEQVPKQELAPTAV